MKLFSKKGKFSLRKRLNKILLIVSLILVLFFFNLFQPGLRNFFYLISFPLQKILWLAGDKISDFFDAISQMKDLKEENEELKLKTGELLAENVGLKELKKENQILREALKIGLEKEFKLILVQIAGKDISQDYILINKGAKDGLSENLPVINEKKALIGKIDKVYKNFSKVILISNPKVSFDGKVSQREVFGLIRGKGNGRLSLDLISKEVELKEGDLIITTPLAGIFPGRLLVGEIKKIQKRDIEPFQQIEVKPYFKLEELEILFVIKE